MFLLENLTNCFDKIWGIFCKVTGLDRMLSSLINRNLGKAFLNTVIKEVCNPEQAINFTKHLEADFKVPVETIGKLC